MPGRKHPVEVAWDTFRVFCRWACGVCWLIAGFGWWLSGHGQPGAINMAAGVGVCAVLSTLAIVFVEFTEWQDRREERRR